MTRILLLSASYAPLPGGLQTVTHALARHLSAQGHEVQVVTTRYPRHLPAQETIEGVPVQRLLFLRPSADYLRGRRLDLAAASLYFAPLTRQCLARLMQELRPDVVNIHYPDAQIPFVLWLRERFSFRLVVSLHGGDVQRWFDNALPAQEMRADPQAAEMKTLLNRADAVTACSRYLVERALHLEPSLPGKAFVVQNGVDLKRFEDKTRCEHPHRYLLAYGRLAHVKGFDMLLEAFARLCSDYGEGEGSKVNLIVAGEGPLREALQAQARNSGVEGRIKFYGQASPEQIVRLLNGCVGVVVPSRSEAFGIAALEALVAGKPLLASRVGGLPDVIETVRAQQRQESNVFGDTSPCRLVAPTVEALHQGLLHWLPEALLAGEENTVPTAWQAHYSWDNAVRRYEAILTDTDGSGS